ncbi:putative mrna-capping enzyme subunit beta protein [Phaeoacremonium minimum UCRPA7]|uniref:mRNA-capping enzyme subunit beta n=1 Tax=Phaeoacremonium minimum (strain UCR-PA7) TaxID=1286976 RepID=R8BSN3_PHAM7|nr:putative mrna-capping enzyme subunit beta protein [Phaeoacremonium minimum UCRPA7]EOO02393.1 putative mrna-capping enzyme subunit beta protein [Phaeoacremonium minimum UCRPA7]
MFVSSMTENPRVPIKYRHRREMDRFYELPPAMRNRLPPPVQNLLNTKHRVKVRVTTDKQSQQVLAKIVKVRVADLDIHFPDTTLDCRISVNLEIDWHDSIQELEQLAGNAQIDRQSDRNKDRLSYSQSHYQIDLTQVTQKMPGPSGTERVQKEHELEIEVDGPALVDHGTRALHGELSAYAELVEGFVDNIRLLARKAKEFGGN